MIKINLTRRGVMLGSAAAAAGIPALARPGRLWANGTGPRRYHALLVGVTEYPELPRSNWLAGPNNDVRLMRQYLLESAPVPFDEEGITVLADNLEGADGSPTLQNIRTAMEELAGRAAEGDFVYLQFSGHGHQQPARQPEQEIDGLDEVFMPRDTGMMTRENRFWPNAYVDKDIKEDIDRIRNRGAFVWALFDCCHSATMTRNLSQADAGEVARQIDLRSMDIPDDFWQGARRGFGGTPRQTMLSTPDGFDGAPAPGGKGGLVAFFASQTIEPTFEMLLPRDAEEQTQMGLFTFSVLQQLGRNPAITYRQLGDSVLQRYIAMGRRAPIPMFEGPIDEYVLGLGDARYIPQWQVQTARDSDEREIAAGHVHQLEVGTRLAVLRDPTDEDLSNSLGLVEIVSAGAMRSTLGPVMLGEGDDPEQIAMIAPSDIPDNAWVRVVDQVIAMELAVARPAAEGLHRAEAERVTALLDRIASDDKAPFRLRLVDPNAPADLRLDVMSRADVVAMMDAQEGTEALSGEIRAQASAAVTPELWLLDAAATVSLRPGYTPPSRSLAGPSEAALEEWLRESLLRVYRATNLARMAGTEDFSRGDVTVELYLKRNGGRVELPLAGAGVPFARPGDEVHLRVVNRSRRAVDVHALFIGADYSIVPAAHPERLFPDDPGLDRGLFGISADSFGLERVVVAISDETDGIGPRLDLSHLAQAGVRSALTPRGGGASLRGLIDDMAFASAPQTRGGVVLGAGPQEAREAVLVFSLDVSADG